MDSTSKKPIIPDIVQLIIVGESVVGKSSILCQYTENKFNVNGISTNGIDLYIKNEVLNGVPIQVKIWDTAGQERFQSQTNSMFKKADGVILVYDVTKPETFESLKNWLNSIHSNKKDSNLKIVLLGNKIDLQREVSMNEAKAFANENKVEYFETSAMKNTNINESIQFLVNAVIHTSEYKLRKEKMNAFKLEEQSKKTEKEKEKNCCKN